ncbi:uncharacterized protein LOC114932485 isoform X2 [Nylanderia fulva]|uniref:uncharacterized protein LOC114932485 isoform X2 n=1 Tax=Nylanderia fulva TaxID=613905 RepID=UPI0010FB191B|nr:uncharacterized protein LOC114932485 isoform X2 [Nylanderia fulva]
MLRQRTFLLSNYLLAFSASLILALPPGGSWTSFASKPVYSRALGPPGGMDTISVPYAPKSPFFPKFVDPKAFISTKTDMLSNLFGGLGPVTYNVADAKPIVPYGASGFPVDNTDSANALFNKRDILQEGKEKAIDNSGIYKRGMFGPFASKFGPMGPKFGPVTPFSSSETIPNYLSQTPFSRKRRSIEAPSSAGDINSIPSSYPKDPQIVENTSTKSAASSTPKEYLPGIFGSFGPGGPYGASGPVGPSGSFGSVVDPSMLTAKKADFLDTLFKNLATSTPATTTEIPTPKSTIVPASFWLPSSVIPGPTEYTQKVSDFLDKLFDSIKLNATAQETDDSSSANSNFMRSVKPDDILPDKNARSLDDASSIVAAKDAIVDIILSELGNLKSDMIATLNDLIAYEKTATTAAATSKKPFKPFSSIFPFAKPTVDPTLPFQQRMAVLSQVFDMLTDLQKNITVVAKDAITTSTSPPDILEELPKAPLTDNASINNTLLDAILKKISTIETVTMTSYPASSVKENTLMSRALPTSFWVSYPENSASAVRRQADNDLLPYLGYENDDNQHNHRQYTRGVKMQMHQGYQSLPAGSIESVQAGGGSTPEHQGGGIKLLIQMPKLPKAPGFQSINYN